MAPYNSPSVMAVSHWNWRKNAVEIASEAELVGTLEQIRAAVEQGELDELIEAQAAWRNRVNTIKQQ